MSIRCNELKIPAAIGVGEKIFEDIRNNLAAYTQLLSKKLRQINYSKMANKYRKNISLLIKNKYREANYHDRYFLRDFNDYRNSFKDQIKKAI